MSQTPSADVLTMPPARTPEQWFRTPELTQRLNLLAHLVQSSDLVLLVTAPEGGGKSTVAAMLAHHFEEQALVCRMRGDRLTDARRARSDLLVCCAEQFALQSETLDEQLAEAASNLQRRARQAILLVDDAHRASTEALESLLELRDQGVWRLVLFLEPDITHPLLDGRGHLLSTDAGHMVQLPPLTTGQVEAYVAHRLRTAGLTDAPSAEQLPLRQMAESSGGLPGRLDAMIAAHLQNGGERRAAVESSAAPRKPGRESAPGKPARWKIPLAAALIAGLAGGALYYQEEINRLFAPPEEVASTPEERVVSPGPTGNAPPPVAESPPRLPSAESAPRPGEEVESEPAPTAEEALAEESAAGAESVPQVAAKPESGPQPPPAVEPEPPGAVVESPAPAAEVSEVPPPEPAPPPVLDLPKGEILQGQWLAIADGDHYTLQLASAGNLDALMKVVQAAGLPRDRLAWYRTEYRGQAWYVLVHGDYADVTRARAAIRKLPPRVRRNKPWPRPIAIVRKEIKEGK